MKKQIKVPMPPLALISQGKQILSYYELIIEEYFSDSSEIEEDLALLKSKYNLTPEALKEIEDKLVSEKDTKIKLAEKANALMTEVFFLRSGLKVDTDIFDMETKIVDPFEIVKLVEKKIKSLTNKHSTEIIKKAISRLGDQEINVENISAKIDSKFGITAKKIKTYLGQVKSVKDNARANNPKVKD